MDTSASAAAAAATDAIDALLERYLGLLHEYAGLRAELAAAQAGVFADLARANFAAERGLRYGADHEREIVACMANFSPEPTGR